MTVNYSVGREVPISIRISRHIALMGYRIGDYNNHGYDVGDNYPVTDTIVILSPRRKPGFKYAELNQGFGNVWVMSVYGAAHKEEMTKVAEHLENILTVQIKVNLFTTTPQPEKFRRTRSQVVALMLSIGIILFIVSWLIWLFLTHPMTIRL